MKKTDTTEKVYIILVNWNSWFHTIECLESIFRNEYPSWQVIVCDNNSSDGSLEYIKAWANGQIDVLGSSYIPSLRQLIYPPVNKPISYTCHNREETEDLNRLRDSFDSLILIQTGDNLGFAGGNNVALRYALNKDDFSYVWLLNNDTVIKKDTLSQMVHKIKTNSNYGMCGSTIRYYHNPQKIQAKGGNVYNRWIGHTSHIGFLDDVYTEIDENQVEQQLDCILGTSMLLTKNFLRVVGLMDDIYFLYFEEIDWALRAKNKFHLAYASQSVVYHKEGGTIGGGNRDRQEKSVVADYFEIRNRIVLARKFFPGTLPTVILALAITFLNRIRRRQWNRLGMIFKIVVDAFQVKLH